MTEIKTAAYIANTLKDAGWNPAAVQVAVKMGANARHEERVRATLDASGVHAGDLAVVAAWLGVYPDSEHETLLRVLEAWGLLELDLQGYGGPHGVGAPGGDCTTRRLPCFKELGKGRKRAADGPAWMAAAEDARGRIINALAQWVISVAQGRPDSSPFEPPRIVPDGHELGVSFCGMVVNPQVQAEWVVGACKRALWEAFGEGDLPELTPELQEWGELLVAASAAGPGALAVPPSEEGEAEVIPSPRGVYVPPPPQR